MTRTSFIMPVAIALASLSAGCEKAQVETLQSADSITKPEWEDTLVIHIEFSDGDRTRGSVDDAKVSDLWLFDYIGDSLAHTIHQQKTDDGFGTIALAADYGKHHLRLVASAGTDATVADSIITWVKPGDTFFAADSIDIEPQGSKDVAITMKRIASRLRISVNDEIPAGFATLSISGTWYYGLNAHTGEATGQQAAERTISVPATYVGTTGQLSAGFYTMCPVDGYTTDVTVKALKSDQSAMKTIELKDVPLKRNRVTAYSGTMFGNTRSMSLAFDTDWDDAYEATW